MSSHFNTPEFDHKAFAKYLAENKLTSSSRLHSLNEGIEEVGCIDCLKVLEEQKRLK